MSTPKKIRRHAAPTFDQEQLEHRAQDWTAGIHSPQFAASFASIVAEFEHIEESMVFVFASLLGVSESGTARVVYHTLRNPKAKSDILRTLLEASSANSGLGPEFDKLLADYNAVRSVRNRLVHGLWWTDSNSRVYGAQHSLNGYAILDAVEMSVDELNALLTAQRDFQDELYGHYVESLPGA